MNPSPIGTPENSPAIHRWAFVWKANKSHQGRKNPSSAPHAFLRPCGACALLRSQPTVETVGNRRSSLTGLSESVKFASSVVKKEIARRRATIVILCLSLASALLAATYYVDCLTGNDGNDGLKPLAAWRTINRANLPTYAPSDSILLLRGCTWQGTGFKAHGNGTVQSP